MNNNNSNRSGVPPPSSNPSQPPELALIPVATPAAQAIIAAPAPQVPQDVAAAAPSPIHPAPRPMAAATLQEALRWSVEARGGDTDARALPPMSDEDRQFLLGAMQGLDSDTSDSLKVLIARLADPHTPADRLCTLLDGLQDAAEDTDMALGLLNLHGLDACVTLVGHVDSGVQKRALKLLALAAQNNPPVQSHLDTVGALEAVLARLHDPTDEEVRFRALSALSCLVRGNDNMARRLLATHTGHSLLFTTITAAPPRAATKALHLVRCLIQQNREFQNFLIVPSLFDALFHVLPSASDDMWEQVLSILVLCPRSALSPAHATQLTALLASRRAHLSALTPDAAAALQSQATLLNAVERILLQQ